MTNNLEGGKKDQFCAVGPKNGRIFGINWRFRNKQPEATWAEMGNAKPAWGTH